MGRIERINVGIPYTPRGQFVDFHNRKQRWAALVAHRRAGKTVACVNELIKAALTCPKQDPRFAYVAPYYAQAKDVAWSYLKRFAAPIPGHEVNESELRVDFPNGGRVRLYGADNYDRMRGLYLDGVVLDEPADMDPRAWPEVIRPALSDRRGWATFIGTPKWRNWFYDLVAEGQGATDEWFTAILRASETGLIAPEELEDLRKALTPEQFEQELECSFEAAILGAYYGKDIAQADKDKRILDVPWEPALPVITAWDLGLSDSTAIWFAQIVGQQIRVIDYYEVSGQSLVDTARALRSEKPYMYGEHFLPHDVEVKELTTARSRKQTLESLGIRPVRVCEPASVDDGINAVRLMLPKCVFDKTKCERGLEALRQYRTAYDEKRRVFANHPLHDWTSHAADAFRYLSQSLRPKAAPQRLDYKQLHRGLA